MKEATWNRTERTEYEVALELPKTSGRGDEWKIGQDVLVRGRPCGSVERSNLDLNRARCLPRVVEVSERALYALDRGSSGDAVRSCHYLSQGGDAIEDVEPIVTGRDVEVILVRRASIVRGDLHRSGTGGDGRPDPRCGADAKSRWNCWR